MTSFHAELGEYIGTRQGDNATKLILKELGLCLVKSKEDFVEILRNAGIPASVNDNEVVLIEKFSHNAQYNKKLLLGASLLINHQNRKIGFDGEKEISDAGVKNTYKVLYYSLIGEEEEYSNFLPILEGIGKAILGGIQKTKEAKEAEKTKSQVSATLLKTVLDQKKKEAQAKELKIQQEKKKATTLIVGTSAVIFVGIMGLVIYKNR